jgi:GNAT superfamily N-acetyltransferase
MKVEVRTEERAGPGRLPGLRVSAHRGGKQLGECVFVSAAEWHDAEEAHDWAFVNWLGVERWAQGQGLGRYLLQRALREAHLLGYRHAAISTGWRNHRAFGFYSNYGFHMVDWTYQMERRLP